jgi:hypothetical protein
MARYYVRLVNLLEAVINLIELEADSDEAAVEQAYHVKLPSVGAGFDVLKDNPSFIGTAISRQATGALVPL